MRKILVIPLKDQLCYDAPFLYVLLLSYIHVHVALYLICMSFKDGIIFLLFCYSTKGQEYSCY